MWTDRPPANPRRLSEPTRKYTSVRVERRGGRKFYYRPDLDAYMAFQSSLAQRMVVLRLHKPIRICAECEKPWPCEDYRKAHRR
jgi:Holliday junction resolvase RusA-like endonuclease